MTVGLKWAGAVREILRDAKPADTAESKARRDFALYDFNAAPAPLLEQTPRARAEREIGRIASWYGWGAEVARALDRAGAASLAGLGDQEIEQLLDRMRQLENCAQEGLDSPDMPPAR
jgi:hypothetical protein